MLTKKTRTFRWIVWSLAVAVILIWGIGTVEAGTKKMKSAADKSATAVVGYDVIVLGSGISGTSAGGEFCGPLDPDVEESDAAL